MITLVPILGTSEFAAAPDELTLAAVAALSPERRPRISSRLGAWARMSIELSPTERSLATSPLADVYRRAANQGVDTVRPGAR